MESAEQDIIVMTGATSGLGLHALRELAKGGSKHIIIGARRNQHKIFLNTVMLQLDLASLNSVKKFANQIIQSLDNRKISALVLNAGVQNSTTDAKSDDGYELTFAVNHLAHYLLVRILLPYICKNGRIVITTSDTHDPSIAPMAPKSLTPFVWAYNKESGFGTGIRAYAASKLCNIMTALYLAKREIVTEQNIEIIAFNPGLTGGTGLGRESSGLMKIIVTILMHTVFRIIGLFQPEFIISTPDVSGKALADVTLGEITMPLGRQYISLVNGKATFPKPSALALDKNAQKRLWDETEEIIEITTKI